METESNIPRRAARARVLVGMTFAAIVLGLAWRIVRWAAGFPIWGDEAFIVTSLYARDFVGMMSPLDCGQVAPLGFMWAELGAAKLLGMSEWALRAPSMLCGLASMVMLARFARRTLDRRSSLLAVLVFAASYYVVRHATEVKPYACDLFVSLAITSLGWSVYMRRESLWRWAALTVVSAVGLWFSYPSVFVAGGVALMLAWSLVRVRSWRALVGWAVYCAILGASFLVMYFTYARPQAEATTYMLEIKTWRDAFPPISKPWLLPWWFLKVHTGNLLAYPVGGKNFGSAATFILVLAGCLHLWRSRRRALLGLLLSPLALMLVAAALKKYPYGTSARVSQHMAPAFCLLAGAGLAAILRFRVDSRRALANISVAAAVLGLIAVVGLTRDLVSPYKKVSDEANRRALRQLSSRTQESDRWIVFNALTRDVPHAPYIHQWGGSAARFRYYVHRFAPAEVLWSPSPQQVIAAKGDTWLIAYRDNRTPFPAEQFQAYVDRLTERLGEPVSSETIEFGSEKNSRGLIEAMEVRRFSSN